MNARQRQRKHAQRVAHAQRKDNRRPPGSPLLSELRKIQKAQRKQARG